MAVSKELITKIVLKGQADPSLSSAFKRVSQLSDSSLGKLQSYGQTAKKILKGASTAVVAGLATSVKSAIDYESAFAGVMKTVEETGTTSYEDLSNSILSMSERLPTSAEEIAGVAEVAGQLGIKADDIAKFTETMINLGETTNIVSDEAASTIAKYFNITKTGMDDVDRFGATLVALGNNAATTEADIMNMASRIGASGSMIGLSNQEILALATSLSSVGLEAEGGGTAISTVLSKIDKEVATNGETLSTWASLAGMSAKEFKTAWADDTMGTIQKVVSGMGDAKAGGTNLNVILEELGITGIRTSDTMKRLTNASDLMSEMTNLANTAWDENTALTKEANTRYKTLASKIQMAKNKLQNVAITIGNALMPTIDGLLKKMDKIDFDAVADKIVEKINWVIENFDKVKVGLSILAGAFAVFKIGGFITTVAGATKELKSLYGAMGLAEKFSKIKAGGMSAAFAGAGAKISTAFKGIATALGSIPVYGWIILAVIVALTGAFIALWKTSESFRTKFLSIWSGLKEKFQSFADGIVERINLLGFDFQSFGEMVVTIGKFIWKYVGKFLASEFITVFEFIARTIGYVLNIITGFVDIIVGIFTGDWARVWEGVKAIVINSLQALVDSILMPFRHLWNLFGGLIIAIKNWLVNAGKSVIAWFKQLPSNIATWLSNTAQKIATWGSNLWTKAKQIGANFVNSIINFFKQLPYKIGFVIGFVIGKIIEFGKKLWNFATVTIPQIIVKIVSWFKQLPSKIWTWLVNTWNKFVAWRNNMYQKALEAGRSVVNAVINFIRTLPSKLWTWLVNTAQKVVAWKASLISKGKAAATGLLNSIVNKIKELPSKLQSLGKSIVQGLWNGIKNAKNWLIDRIKSFANGITDGIKEALGINSPSVVMEKVFKWVPVGAANGIINNAKYAINAVKNMGGKIANTASKITPTIQTKVASVSNKIKKFGTGGTVTTPQHAIVGDRPETIVPHGNTPRNRSLLMDAARGVGQKLGGAVYNITFAPVINGGNASDIKHVLEDEEEKFKQMMDKYFREKGVLAY